MKIVMIPIIKVVKGQIGLSPNGKEFDVYEALDIELITWKEAVEAIKKYNRSGRSMARRVVKDK